jgi:DNA-binding CsgD family transcriptional regulator
MTIQTADLSDPYESLYEKSMQRLNVLGRFAETVAIGNNTKDSWRQLLKEIVDLMGASIGSINMLSDDYKRLICMTAYPGNIAPDGTDIPVSELAELPFHEILQGRSVKLDDISEELNDLLNHYHVNNPYRYKSLICSPILIGSTISGGIVVSSSKLCCFIVDDLNVLDSIGYIIGTAFHNSRLLTMLNNSRNALVNALSSIDDARMEEREALSRELHDDIGQQLKALQQEHDPVTKREYEVLLLTAKGFTSREIGEKLYISPRTVETHRQHLMDKLGFRHRSELLDFVLREKLF